MAPPPPPRGTLRSDDGAQALELTLVIPVLLMLAMVVIAVGQVVLGLAGVHQLAITAARTAAVAHDGDVHALLADAGLRTVDIQPPSGSRTPGQPVTVTLTRPVDVVVISRTLDLTASATFRTEDVP